MGAAAPANLSENAPDFQPGSQPEPPVQTPPQVSASQPAATPSGAPMEKLRSTVLQALTDSNQRVLVSMLEAGEWSVEGNEVVVRVSESQTVVDMSVGAETRRLAVASASGVLGRAVKLKVVGGATVKAAEGKRNGGGKPNGAGPAVGRSRAEQDAVVRRLQEKFGAEIRTVIDYKERR
jgi:hypothetical protein